MRYIKTLGFFFDSLVDEMYTYILSNYEIMYAGLFKRWI